MYEVRNTQLQGQLPPVNSIGQAETGDIEETMQEMYNRVRGQCREWFDSINPDFCDSILPQRPIYLPPPRERTGFKWYWWVALGYLAAKIL